MKGERNRVTEFHRLRSIETDECVEWPYATNGAGYGWLHYEGRAWLTHRLALSLATGVLDQQLHAIHGPCHNSICMNVRHLSWGTRSRNMADRNRDGTGQRGQGNHRARLTESEVKEILVAPGTQSEVAERFGICQSHVSALRRGARWTHLTGALKGMGVNKNEVGRFDGKRLKIAVEPVAPEKP
jgi:hypothetical protein